MALPGMTACRFLQPARLAWSGYAYNLTWSKCFDLKFVEPWRPGRTIRRSTMTIRWAAPRWHIRISRKAAGSAIRTCVSTSTSGVYKVPDIPHLGRLAWAKAGSSAPFTPRLADIPFGVFKNGAAILRPGADGAAIRGDYHGDPSSSTPEIRRLRSPKFRVRRPGQSEIRAAISSSVPASASGIFADQRTPKSTKS